MSASDTVNHRKVSMSHAAIPNRSLLFAALASMSAAGFLMVAPPAQADPSCLQFSFLGDFSLKQANGYTVSFNSNGPVASGDAVAVGKSGDRMQGPVSGGIQGSKVDFTVRWNVASFDGDNAAYIGHYVGDVDAAGYVHGTTSNDTQPRASSPSRWNSTSQLGCTTLADPPPPASPSGPSQNGTATVVGGDVDVHNGLGDVIGVLRDGQQVEVTGTCRPDSQCRVLSAELPAGFGFVQGHLQF
jgi:hypothetical protein